MSNVPTSPAPDEPVNVRRRPDSNLGRLEMTFVSWVSIVLVPVAGFVAMLVDEKAGWGAVVYLFAIGPGQAVAHLIVAIMFQVAYVKAPDRPVSRWIPVTYATYLLAFLAAAYLFLDEGDWPEHYSPLRESAAVAVGPLVVVFLASFAALVVLVMVDLARAAKAQAAARDGATVAPGQ